jgi:hypothetical protein
MPETQTEVVALLRENNDLLRQLLHLKKVEHRDAIIQSVLHILVSLLPFIALAVLGYFAWIEINHYLEILNSNINALKANFDALREFFAKLIPDFSGISSQLNNTWQSVQFWK